MKWFMDLKISAKLLVGFIFVAIIAAIVGVVGIVNMKAIEKSDMELYESMTVPISELADISTQFQRTRVNIRDIILTNDPLVIKNNLDEIAQRQANIAKDLESYKKTILSANMSGLYDDLVKKNATFGQQITKVIDLANQNKEAEAIALISETGTSGIASRELQNAIDNIIKVKLDDAKTKSINNNTQSNSTTVTMIIIICVGVLIAIGLGVFLSSIISKPMKFLTEAAEKLAVGDVDVDVSAKRKTKDELGTLMGSFEKMVETIKDQVKATESIAAGDLSVTVNVKSEKDVLSKKLVEMKDIIKALVGDANMLAKAAVEGKLATRADASKHGGDFGRIVDGVNKTLDSVIAPVMEASAVLEEMAKGNLSISVKGEYKGDHAKIKNALNDTISTLHSYVTEYLWF